MGLGGYLAARIDAEHYASEYGRERTFPRGNMSDAKKRRVTLRLMVDSE